MKKIALMVAAFTMLGSGVSHAENKYEFSRVNGVVELFTSQGCSSCPPADAYMGALKKDDNSNLVLTYGVTIWDYLGWKDKFGTKKNTNRQKQYSHYMGLRSVYTPQSVIGGNVDAVGSDRYKIPKSLKASHLKNTAYKVEMSVTEANMKLMINIGDAPKNIQKLQKNPKAPIDATLWLVKYKDVAKVDIKAGENGGKKIAYHNVVGDYMPLGMWDGKAQNFTISYRDLKGVVGDVATDKFAFLLQLDGVGPIVAAVKVL